MRLPLPLWYPLAWSSHHGLKPVPFHVWLVWCYDNAHLFGTLPPEVTA